MLLNGEHPKVVSERLGHSRISTTMDVYSHVLPNMQTAAAARFDALLGTGVSNGTLEGTLEDARPGLRKTHKRSNFELDHVGGDDRIRTGDGGFADRCLAAWLRRHGRRLQL